jgi:hypothetical protein
LNWTKTIRSEENGAGADRNARMEAEIGRILATEEKLIPSSGFMASVMEQVRQEAALPRPISFPWTWAVAGILLAGGVFGWGVFEILRPELPALDILALRALTLPSPQAWVPLAGPVEEVGWVAMALVISLLCWLLSRRLAGSGGLL